jgi:thioesterase domain-containing protein
LKTAAAIVPGTAYIELVTAAAAAANVPGPEIQNLYFLLPLYVPEGASIEVRTTLERIGEGYQCSVTSRARNEWIEHAMCDVVPLTSPAKVEAPWLESLRKRCRTKQMVSADAPYTAQGRHINFGPRWDCLRRVDAGKGEAIAEIELREEFASDLNTFKAHPALLDMATGYGLPLVSDYGPDSPLYIPLSYRRIRISGDLPRRFYSYIRSRNESTDRQEVASFDVTLFDADGRVLMSIEEFTVRKSDAAKIALQPQAATVPPTAKAPQIVEVLLKHGIEPAEGAEAFRRILESAYSPQVVVSPLDLRRLQEEMRPRSKHATRKVEVPESLRADGPSNDVEKYLVTLWQDLLGCGYVGVNDDFFELGGHSLIAVRLFTKLKKVYKIDLGLATLFTARTPRQLAALLPRDENEEQVNRGSSKPPLFIVHGLGGDVGELSTLAAELGTEQPVYTLQTHTTNGDVPRVEEIASRYLDDVRNLQPEGPYYLLASSTGGLIAFVMAQQLRAGKQEVGMLGLLDAARADHNVRSKLMRLVKRTFASDHSEYTPAPYQGRAILFRASGRPENELYENSYLRWKELAAGGLEVQDIQGSHMLAQALNACIARASANAPANVPPANAY